MNTFKFWLISSARLTWLALGLLMGLQAQAALNITPPQLAPDDNGIIATEVKSSLGTATRWSVRVIHWDPSQPNLPRQSNQPGQPGQPGQSNSPDQGNNPKAIPISAPAALTTSSPTAAPTSALAAPIAVQGVEISPRFFSLTASGRQIIRARITDRSKHYRLLIEQIPNDTLGNQGINFRFRFSLPIYKSSQDPLIPRGILIQ
jgi:hypothetical protein